MGPGNNLSAKTLGQIALIQGMVAHLPDQKSILQFVCRGLEVVPGTNHVGYVIFDPVEGVEAGRQVDRELFDRFPLQHRGNVYGEIVFNVSAPDLFKPYIPYIENLSNMLGVIFEERRQRHMNELHKVELEQRVQDRTQELAETVKALEKALDAHKMDESRLEALLTLFQMTDAEMMDIIGYALKEAIRLTKSKIGYLAFTSENESILSVHSWSEETLKLCNIKDKAKDYNVAEMGLWGEAIRQRKPIITNDYQSPSKYKKGYPEGHIPLTRHMNVPVFEQGRIVTLAGVGNKEQAYDDADVRQLNLLMQGMWRLIQRKKANDEKEELENKLRQSYKMESIGTLAGGIAHDFNNILSAIFGYTELALSETIPDTFLHGSLSNVLSASKRARDLTSHILAFSRQGDQEVMPVEIAPMMKEVTKFMRASLPSSIEIKQKINESLSVLGDPTQIHQVIMNLCANAGHAMQDKGGVLEVGLETMDLDPEFVDRHPGLKPGVHVKLTVSDTGYGIPPEIMERIFDPFFTTKERGVGTGMGLSVVHGIVKSHGGTIMVNSSPGRGTAFNVFLPAIERRAPEKERPDRVIVGGSERILFVDDEQILVDLGVTMLSAIGYKVTGVSSSVDALKKLKSSPHQFDLVVTDLTMPKMTGDRLARECRKIKPDIPVILCTGFSTSINEDTAEAMGINAFIKKPILRHQLSEAIRNVLDKTKTPYQQKPSRHLMANSTGFT